MSIREDILDQFGDDAHTMLFADGFDDFLVGVGSAFGGDLCAIYDADAIIESLMKQGMDYAEAMEHFDFNIAGAYVGEQTPIFMHKIERNTNECN
jgi:hypothetical protein